MLLVLSSGSVGGWVVLEAGDGAGLNNWGLSVGVLVEDVKGNGVSKEMKE